VLVALSGPQSRVNLLVSGLRDAMSRLNAALTLRTVPTSYMASSLGVGKLPPSEPEANANLARLFIDLHGDRSALLYVVDDQRQRVFVRHFPSPSGFDEVAAEQIVLVAASSVESLLAGQLIGVAQQDFAASSREKPTAPCAASCPETRPGTAPTLAAAYAVSWLGPGALAHGPALALGLRRSSWGLGTWLQGKLPLLVGTGSSDQVSIRLTTLGFRQRGYLVLRISEGLAFLPGLGVGVDFTHVSPRGTGQGNISAEPSYWAADGQGQGFVAVSHAARGFSMAGRLGCDVTTSRAHYVLVPGATDVFVPFQVRPWLELELITDAL
jgi:hypothetical protein